MKQRWHLALLGVFSVTVGTTLAHAQTVNITKPIIGKLAAEGDGWSPVEILDVERFPVDKQPRFRTKSKTIFKGPEEGALIYSVFVPPWHTRPSRGGGMGMHYHLWWEWGFTLKGDSVLTESVSPYQKNGMKYWKPQGGWLDRPPYSLHGGSWETGGGLRSQNPYYLLLYEEGDGSVVTVGPQGDHFKPDFRDKPDPYLPDWKSVKQWRKPWLVDTANDLEWESDEQVAGRFVKWLSDDQTEGFRAQLVKIPPGWTPPEGTTKTYFQNANRMRYVIWGAMKVWVFDGPDDDGTAVDVKEDFFIYQPPRSIWGYGDGPVSEDGAYWLEVTYSRGLSHGGGPIEEPTAID